MSIRMDEAVDAAYSLLRSHLGEGLTTRDGEEVVVLTESITEYPAGWLVPFNTKSYLESGDFSTAIIPSVVLVPKDTSIRPHFPPSAFDVPEYLAMVASGEMRWSGQS